uniref:Uncharacterized protein n=1 Tax=Chromera velia CCMP2878 TaxID=1169474 RepID=A0A0G4HYJ0_9ALVE|eukprot:Cvel_9503.t1-p1 / transcript=Cvel_9503.t1 / gene=Cvel_9503 / organism=Chromera_velia_CCMP2878 / gene_product=Protein NLRC3, putative / transcript_product=Protein NLRC3, putative / location=Cvel_scaffold549:40271-45941(-) / protein_length=977 / sequence_SO=supercontig / SO=protein_coding / is_pseudo=false
MSLPAAGPAKAVPEGTASGVQPVDPVDAVLSAVFGHSRPTSEEISALASHREGFGIGWAFLQFVRTGRLKSRFCLPVKIVDLSEFLHNARKLKVFLGSLPSSPSSLKTLKCGPDVCTPECLPVLTAFLSGSLEEGNEGKGAASCLKTLIAASCGLDDCPPLFISLPPSLECLDLKGNRFRRPSMESLTSALEAGRLPSLFIVDLSDNPLGPSGVRALAKGLCIPLQSLRLARTGARGKGVEALAEVLKEKKVTSLCLLDVEGNSMGAGGLRHLGGAICTAGAVPHLQVLILRENDLTDADLEQRDYAPLSELLSTDQLRELEELDLSGNKLFDQPLGVEGGVDRVSAAALAAAGRFPKLQILNLANNGISSEETALFANALGKGEGGPSVLEDLDLSGVCSRVEGEEEEEEGEGEGVQAVANAVSSGRLSRLISLRLRCRGDLTSGPVTSLLHALGKGKSPNLRAIEVKVLEQVAEHPDEVPNLPVVYDKAVGAVVSAVEGEGWPPKIETLVLDFWNGYLRSACMGSLGRALGSGRGSFLRQLELNWFCIGGDETNGGGLLGLAESLGEGGMPLLEDLSLCVGCGGSVGGAELGKALSEGKVPSLRSVKLGLPVREMLSAVCDGLCAGTSPPPLMRMQLFLHNDTDVVHGDPSHPILRLAEAIRSGRMFFLQKLSSDHACFDGATATLLGEALMHKKANLVFLEEISLEMPQIDVSAFFLDAMCARGGCLPSLRMLDLGGVSLNVDLSASLSTLISSGRLPSLSECQVSVDLNREDLVDAFEKSLMSPHSASLRRIQLYFSYLSANSLMQLTRFLLTCLASEYLTKLEVLEVKEIGENAGVLSLCEGIGKGKLVSLRELTLREVSFEFESEASALSAALEAEKVPRLSVLKIISASMTDNGLKVLTESWASRPPPPLEHLDFFHNTFTDKGAESLAEFFGSGSQRMPFLSKISLRENAIGEGGKAMLRKALPDVVDL